MLTGRYAWLTRMNNRVILNSNEAYNGDLILFPQLLDANNYNTFIAGKWHIGYSDESLLANNRGFKNGLYSHQPLQYYSRVFPRTIAAYDRVWGRPSPDIVELRTKFVGGPRTSIPIHDTYEITNYIETPTLKLNTDYNEDLYTESVKSFIAEQDGENPFFVYYSLWTPHGTIIDAPNNGPDGSTMDYAPCINAFPNITCEVGPNTRCVFCKQSMLFFCIL